MVMGSCTIGYLNCYVSNPIRIPLSLRDIIPAGS